MMYFSTVHDTQCPSRPLENGLCTTGPTVAWPIQPSENTRHRRGGIAADTFWKRLLSAVSSAHLLQLTTQPFLHNDGYCLTSRFNCGRDYHSSHDRNETTKIHHLLKKGRGVASPRALAPTQAVTRHDEFYFTDEMTVFQVSGAYFLILASS